MTDFNSLTSQTGIKMATYILPLWLSNEILCIFDTVGREFDIIDSMDYDVFIQFFPQTATWGLKHWERLLGLSVNESIPMHIRRNKVIARRITRNPVNPKRIQTVVSQLTDRRVDVDDYFMDYTFGIEIHQQDTVPIILSPVIREVNRLKPSAWAYLISLSHTVEITVFPSMLIHFAEYPFCGELICGTYPNENKAIDQQTNVNIQTTSYQVSQPFFQVGTFACGSAESEIENMAVWVNTEFAMSLFSYAVNQEYPICGDFVSGEG